VNLRRSDIDAEGATAEFRRHGFGLAGTELPCVTSGTIRLKLLKIGAGDDLGVPRRIAMPSARRRAPPSRSIHRPIRRARRHARVRKPG
jgi:hypothetical protein